MIEALEEFDAGSISVNIGHYTVTVTNNKQEAEHLSSAWDDIEHD